MQTLTTADLVNILKWLSVPRTCQLSRPGLPSYTRTREELLGRASDVFRWITQGKLAIRIGGRYALEDAPRAHQDLEARRTTGKLLLEMRGQSATGGSPPAG